MIDVKQVLEAGAHSVNVASRLTTVTHPNDGDISVPVALVTTPTANAPGSSVVLASDILKELDARRPGPARREGTTTLTEVASFIKHLTTWGDPKQATVYADTARLTLTAVLDEHPPGPTGTAWRKHRAVYSCPRAAEWVAWTAAADKPMSQTQFGDWIEARLEDLVGGDGKPAPTEMLTIARALHIRTEGTFKRQINPTNGDFVFINETKTSNDSTQIPRSFWIAIPCFEGGDRYQIEVRLRFTLAEGQPLFAFTVHRAREIERDAFDEVRVKVGTETGMLVLAGTP